MLDAGSLAFGESSWIEEVEPWADITVTLDGNNFDVSRDEDPSSPVRLNGFLITVEEYQKALDGETVTLSKDDGSNAELKLADGNVLFDGKSLTNPKKIGFSQSGKWLFINATW